MASWCVNLALIFFALWVPLVLYLAHYWFTRKYNFLHQMPKYTEPEYQPFVRHDRKNWSVVEFIFVGIFIAPLKIFLVVSAALLGFLCNKLLTKIYGIEDIEKEQPVGFARLSWMVNRAVTSVILFSFGFRVRHYMRHFDSEKYPRLQQVAETGRNTTVLISNHVSWVDIVYFMSSNYRICFISKSGVRDYPVVGFYARIMQCIFLNREQSNDRKLVLQKLQERVHNINQGRNFSKIVIFPEGTTTNGDSLIGFKKGAFVLGTPLKVVALKYRGRVSPTFNMMATIDNIVSMFFQLYSHLDVYAFEGLIAPTSRMDWEEYAEAVRDLMAAEFHLNKSNATFKDKKELEARCNSYSEKEV